MSKGYGKLRYKLMYNDFILVGPKNDKNDCRSIEEKLVEIKSNRLYRECEISFKDYKDDLDFNDEKFKFSDLELIFKDLKSLFEKKGYIINWKSLEKQNLNETINALAMALPFSLEEKQILLESHNLKIRKDKIAQILSTYNYDNFENTTIQ